MKIDTKNLISLTDANQNFSKVAKYVEKCGTAIILKNNKPLFLITKFDEANTSLILTECEKIEVIAKRILNNNKRAFEVLGK